MSSNTFNVKVWQQHRFIYAFNGFIQLNPKLRITFDRLNGLVSISSIAIVFEIKFIQK